VPHLFGVLVEVFPVPGESRLCIKRDLEPATRQFLHDIKNIPPRLYDIGGVLDGLDIDAPELLPPVVEAVLISIPPGNGGIPAAAFVIAAVDEPIPWQNRASGEFVVVLDSMLLEANARTAARSSGSSSGYFERTSESVTPGRDNARYTSQTVIGVPRMRGIDRWPGSVVMRSMMSP
jgi:hypothetical protein